MDRVRHIIRDEKNTHHIRSYDGMFFIRYTLSADYRSPRVEKQSAWTLNKRRSQRRKSFFKKLDPIRLNTTYWKSLIENRMYPQNQPQYPPQPQAQPQPSFQDLQAQIQFLMQQNQQLQQQNQEAAKKERQATYHVRRAKGSGNLSLNWGPENIIGAYLTPIKFQDGRCFLSGSGVPATFQMQKTQQGTFLIATVQNGPWNDEEVALWNELFVQPVQVIPQRRGPKGSASNAGSATPVPSAPQQPPIPQQQTQFPAVPQYAPQPTFTPPPAQVPQFQGQPGSSASTIAHLPPEVQNQLIADAQQLMQRVPQIYTSMDIALAAAKKAKNIP